MRIPRDFGTHIAFFTSHALWLGFSEQFSHGNIVRQHYKYLVDTLVVKHSGLVDELYQAKVLSAGETEPILAEVTSSAQNKRLLSVLSRKPKTQFDKFLEALDKTGQHHVRKEISSEIASVSNYYLPRFMISSLCSCRI